MRQLATIQRIADVQPILGADTIEKVQVKDWWCVAKKGEFKTGDLCVYFEIDSLLPKSNPAFSFLERGTKEKTMVVEGVTYTGYRLKTIRLRGQISQGLALPLETLSICDGCLLADGFAVVGQDVSEDLGIVKYEPPIPAQLQGKVKGAFPGFLPKTDEERVQNIGDLVEKHSSLKTAFYVTEKLDGTSATFFKHTTLKEGTFFGVCSRNLELLETEGNTHWAMARKYDLEHRIPNGICIQGEIVGDGIQGNPLGIQGHELYIYNVYDINKASYLSFASMVDFLNERFKDVGLKMVPILYQAYLLGNVEGILHDADGPSTINPNAKREGIVLRPRLQMSEVIGGQNQRFSFKAISNDYLLNEK